MKFKVDEFRAYVKKLIGSGTQAGFAADCGISPEHLSRLLRAERPGCPSKGTIRKLSGGSEETCRELMKLCGYIDDGEDDGKWGTSREEQIRSCADEMNSGFLEMTRHVRTFKCIPEFLDEYLMIYDSSHASFTVGERTEYEGDGHFSAEYAVPVCAKYDLCGITCVIWMIIYYSITTGGRIVVLDTAMDGKSIVETCPLENREEAEKMQELPFIYRIKRVYTAEQRLLKSIMSWDSDSVTEFITSSIGFGIQIAPNTITDSNAAAFIREYVSSSRLDEDAVLERLDSGEDPFKVMDEFEDFDDGYQSGFGTFVSNVMREQTGLLFDSYLDPSGDSEYIVILRNTVDGYNCDLEDIKESCGQFAAELGLDSYGEYVVKYPEYCRNMMKFSVNSNEEVFYGKDPGQGT